MVTRTIVTNLCNVCFKKDGVERPAKFIDSVTLGGGETQRIEVCDEHKTEFIALLAFVKLYGESADPIPALSAVPAEPEDEPPPPARRVWGCNLCEGVFFSPQARAKHYRHDHPNQTQLKAAERVERLG